MNRVVLSFLLALMVPAAAFGQQEGNFFMLNGLGLFKADSANLVRLPNPGVHKISYNDTFDFVNNEEMALVANCNGTRLDHQIQSIITSSSFSPSTFSNQGLYVDTTGLGYSKAFPDPANDSILHMLMPSLKNMPDFSMVQRLHLVSYNRFTFDTLRNIELADSIPFGLHGVIRHSDRKSVWLFTFRRVDSLHFMPISWKFDGRQLSPAIPHSPVRIRHFENPIFNNLVVSPDESSFCVNPGTGSFTLFRLNRTTGQIGDRISVDVQQIFLRPLAGTLRLQALHYSPRGNKIYVFSQDFRSLPYRLRLYQFDVSEWDSLSITRRFYSENWIDTQVGDFVAMPNGELYFGYYDVVNGTSGIGKIRQPDANWGIAQAQFHLFDFTGIRTETFGELRFSHSFPHYRNPRRFSILRDTLCAGDSGMFRLNEPLGASAIEWDMGDGRIVLGGDSLTDLKHAYARAGTYVVRATVQYCAQQIVMTDTIEIGQPPVDRFTDTVLCAAQPFTLDVGASPFFVQSIRWSDGDSSSQKTISSPGWWWVETVGRCGSYRDSFYVSHTPRPFTALPLEVAACRESPPILTLNPGNYRWNWPDGSTEVSFATDTTMDYVVLAYNNHCGSWRDTTFLYWVTPESYADIDTNLCQGEPFVLGLATNRFTQVFWSDGDTSTSRLFREPFAGSARIVTACGEQAINVRLARERCDCELWLPSAFSPNGDGLNDRYVATPECEAALFELFIYDRWGKLVFESTNPAQGWDGTFGGQPLSEGQYAVKARYVGAYSRELKTPGTFLYLIR